MIIPLVIEKGQGFLSLSSASGTYHRAILGQECVRVGVGRQLAVQVRNIQSLRVQAVRLALADIEFHAGLKQGFEFFRGERRATAVVVFLGLQGQLGQFRHLFGRWRTVISHIRVDKRIAGHFFKQRGLKRGRVLILRRHHHQRRQNAPIRVCRPPGRIVHRERRL